MCTAEQQKRYRHKKGISKRYYFQTKVDKLKDVFEYEAMRKRAKVNNSKWWNKKTPEDRKKYIREISRRSRTRIKESVFSHYGYRCACCGETTKQFLCIDHIHGNGNAHRKEIGNENIYNWIIKHGFPKGFQTLCHNCNQGKSINGGICPHKNGEMESKNVDMRNVQEQDVPENKNSLRSS